MTHLIQLPNGRRVTVGEYVRSWRALKTLPLNRLVARWDHIDTPAGAILAKIAYGVHDRINRHIPWHGRGRKWDEDWQRAMIQASIRLNQPRLIIDWLPQDFTRRFAHRLRDSVCQ